MKIEVATSLFPEVKISTGINFQDERGSLKKTIFDEAVNVRLDYEQNPNEDTGSLQPLVVIHQNSDFLKEE